MVQKLHTPVPRPWSRTVLVKLLETGTSEGHQERHRRPGREVVSGSLINPDLLFGVSVFGEA